MKKIAKGDPEAEKAAAGAVGGYHRLLELAMQPDALSWSTIITQDGYPVSIEPIRVSPLGTSDIITTPNSENAEN